MSEATAKKLSLISDAKKSPTPQDGDGGPDAEGVISYTIEMATNGFVLTVIMEDMTEYKEIHQDIEDVFDSIRGTK